MKNQWHIDDRGECPSHPKNVAFPLFSNLTCFLHHSQLLGVSAFRRFEKLARSWLSTAFLIRTDDDYPFKSSNPNFITHFNRVTRSTNLNFAGAFFTHAFTIDNWFKRSPVDILSLPVLSLANLNLKDQTSCDVQQQTPCDLNWVRRGAVEPITGIEFPGLLNDIVAKENHSSRTSEEILVGTGSQTVTIIKIKSLKVYAFGFYVHPYSICQKLGSKYATVSAAKLKDHSDFYADLLREDIGMTLRLVVNCKGMKINAVKDAFEKSLRDRLVKTNPRTDFKCIATFGSFFTKDIPLPVGTIIDIKRTADGRLITEIGGNQIGAVHSKELCRAFFDMYLGEVPVSKQTKEEIGSNVANIVRRC